jgi:hypothetical protein
MARSVMWKVGTSKVVSLPVSVQDRGVGTCKQVLNVRIACWYMGPVNLVACHWQLCGFLHCFYGCEWDRNWMETHRSVSRRAGDVVRSFFSREQWLCPTLLVTHERLLYADYVRYVWSRVICGPSVESMWHVGQVFPCRVYINLNCRHSQIRVTTCLVAVIK